EERIPRISVASADPSSCAARTPHTAIRRGLQCAAQLEDHFQEIWILTDCRASIQHLANWGDIGDQTSLDILSLLHDLSSGHSIHFQWIPSHVGIESNERADFLVRTAAVEGVSPRGNLTFSEISTISKLELNRQIKTPPSHAWHFAKCPGESFRLSNRPLQSNYSRFLSGHTRALRFSNGQKTFRNATGVLPERPHLIIFYFVWVLKRTKSFATHCCF
ncbi:RNase H domain-containing protein, partial [Trichonephila clavipes]